MDESKNKKVPQIFLLKNFLIKVISSWSWRKKMREKKDDVLDEKLA